MTRLKRHELEVHMLVGSSYARLCRNYYLQAQVQMDTWAAGLLGREGGGEGNNKDGRNNGRKPRALD